MRKYSRYTKQFPVGSRVVTIFKPIRKGTRVQRFGINDITDASCGVNFPLRMSDIPIQWEDGTKGYINGLWIKRLSPREDRYC